MKTLIDKFFSTEDNAAALVLRLTAAFIMLPHGLQKLLGWFGGYGFEGTMNYMTSTIGIPWIVAFLVIIGESVGSIMLAVGLTTRFVVVSHVIIMLGALKMHWTNGFFMNWLGNKSGEGFEFHLLYIGIMISLLISGAGKLSIDRLISNNSK